MKDGLEKKIWQIVSICRPKKVYETCCSLSSSAAFPHLLLYSGGDHSSFAVAGDRIIAEKVLGGIAGKNNRTEFTALCRTNKYPREIPTLPWYRSTIPQDISTLGSQKIRNTLEA
ncbi:hypothetical protein R1flu_010637 [Riccia fluitans]|uniref:Uncharacterized protein n=1 Tax=Riccia fluitans TaxID=41844 RepID=A0ABD1Z5J5_9MARC